MNKETRHNIIIFIISVLIIAGIAYGAYYFTIGREGLVNKISSVENEFDKTEVIEKFKELVKEKYMEVYNSTKENSDIKLDEAYNADVAISYLFEKGVIDYYYYSNYDENTKKYEYIHNENVTEQTAKRSDLYYINVENIENVNTFGKGEKYTADLQLNKNDVFVMEKKVENDVASYIIKYFNLDGKEEEVGVLEIANPLIK